MTTRSNITFSFTKAKHNAGGSMPCHYSLLLSRSVGPHWLVAVLSNRNKNPRHMESLLLTHTLNRCRLFLLLSGRGSTNSLKAHEQYFAVVTNYRMETIHLSKPRRRAVVPVTDCLRFASRFCTCPYNDARYSFSVADGEFVRPQHS